MWVKGRPGFTGCKRYSSFPVPNSAIVSKLSPPLTHKPPLMLHLLCSEPPDPQGQCLKSLDQLALEDELRLLSPICPARKFYTFEYLTYLKQTFRKLWTIIM